MRSAIVLGLAAVAVLGAAVPAAYAQTGNEQRQQRTEEANQEEEARRRQLNREFQRDELPLPELANAGPCPFVKVLYDAARTIEFEGGVQSVSAVGWTGEIQGLSATCSYDAEEPIIVQVITTFSVGRGPRGAGAEHTFPYWIAVTDRNRAILGKERFAIVADLPAGEDRALIFDRIDQIVIPRANADVSGANFEVLIGFEVTPEMAEFNRQGSRFRPGAAAQQAAAAGASTGQ